MTMKRIDNKQLASLGSMKELQVAKRRLNHAIKRVESDMASEYEAALELFSWRNVLEYGLSIVDSIQSVVRYLGKGLFSGFVAGLGERVGRRRRAHADDTK